MDLQKSRLLRILFNHPILMRFTKRKFEIPIAHITFYD